MINLSKHKNALYYSGMRKITALLEAVKRYPIDALRKLQALIFCHTQGAPLFPFLRYKSLNFICCLSFSFLTGCSLFPNASEEPSRKFVLDILEKRDSLKQKSKSLHLVLSDNFPIVYAPLEGTRIFLKPAPYSLDSFAGSEWADRLSVLIKSSFYFSLQNSRLFASVSIPSEMMSADRMLTLHVQDFQINYKEPVMRLDGVSSKDPSAQNMLSQSPELQKTSRYAFVRYLAELIEMPSRRLVASRTFQASVPTDASNTQEVILSLNQAHVEAMSACISWASHDG